MPVATDTKREYHDNAVKETNSDCRSEPHSTIYRCDYCIVHKLPYEFGGIGDPNNVAQDFVRGGGTALSAPLVPLLVLAVFIIRERWAA